MSENQDKKRKKKVISIDEKYEAIQRLDAGESAVKIAEDLGVGRSTVGDWKKNRDEIERWCSVHAGSSGSKPVKKRKTMKKSEYDRVSEALFIWFVEKRERDVPISGPILK
ncbi:hypothetical protein PGB90_001117 [Kerria lacca]